MYYYDCAKCGHEIKYRSVELKRVSGLCRRCAAQKSIKELHSKKIKSKTTKRDFERNYNNFVRLSKNKNLKVSISYEDYLIFCKDAICHYCGVSILRSATGNKYGMGYYLDRKNNNLGYVSGNLVNCCTRCNFGKSNCFSYEEWFGMTEYLRNKNKLLCTK